VAGWLNRETHPAQTFQACDALRDGPKRKHAACLPAARVAFGSFEAPNLIRRDFDNTTGPAAQAGRAVVSPNSVGQGSVYTVMECRRLCDRVDSILP
jgi:hypothetical protein